MEYYSIGKFAKLISKSIVTLRLWDKSGVLKPAYTTTGGHRMYSEEQLNEILNLKNKNISKKVIGYCRVSSNKQKADLSKQVQYVKEYMIAKGYCFEVITDIGSGINYNNQGLNKLVDRITNGEVEKVVILYKDRLVRFGFEIIENLCSKYGTTIEVIDSSPETEEQELVEDFIQIVSVFSHKLQGKSSIKAKELIRELRAD
jgi:predicted site-specific integrase-resolvase